jgi:2-dehydro-3-deoxygalactonokinase
LSVRLISVDWGTTSLRLKALDGAGEVIGERQSALGILNCGDRGFAAVLRDEVAALVSGTAAIGAGALPALPVLMSGMIGSRQGWREAAYLRCPAAPGDIAGGLLRITDPGDGLQAMDIRIVPGIDSEGCGDGAGPDVMRGEETQVLGAMMVAGLADGVFLIPGTHSKHIVVEQGRITGFRTFMTGEVYAALLDHTILGRLAEGHEPEAHGFQRGVAAARAAQDAGAGAGDLLNLIFSARTRVLTGGLAERQVTGYLSGLLIGAELLSHRPVAGQVMRLIAGTALAQPYRTAAEIAGVGVEPVDGEFVATAHWAIGGQAGMIA